MTDELLRDSDGDLWEILPESGYRPKQGESWLRHQDEAMVEQALVLTAENTSRGIEAAVSGEQAWAQVYAEGGWPRVYIREVPHPDSTGHSKTMGPRGVYEMIAWSGPGMEGVPPGAMIRALVRPAARWYYEQLTNSQIDLAALDHADPSLEEAIAGLERAIEYNKRAHQVASQADRELSISEMQAALAQEG